MVSKRIEKLASYVLQGSKVLDVGTDHGYLLIYLYLKGISEDLLGVDISYKAITQAMKNIKKQKIDKIKLNLSDGLKSVEDLSSYNCIVISGLGGSVIGKILEQKELKPKTRLLLQPMNNFSKLRKILKNNKFKIIDEDVIIEKNFFYTFIVAEKIKRKVFLSKKKQFLGPKLMESKNKDVLFHYEYKLKQYEKLIFRPIKKSNVKKEYKWIQKILSEKWE